MIVPPRYAPEIELPSYAYVPESMPEGRIKALSGSGRRLVIL